MPELDVEPNPNTSAAQRPRMGLQYEVLDELGRGGMACVYRVRDTRDGRIVALKQLYAGQANEHAREAERLFEREFHTLAQLEHLEHPASSRFTISP